MRHVRGGFLEQFDPLTGEACPTDPEGDAGDVTSRTREAGHDARPNRVDQAGEHDRDRSGCLLRGERTDRGANHEDVDLQPNHLGDESGKAFGPPFRECVSTMTFFPSTYPRSPSPCRNAWIVGPGEIGETTPIRYIFAACCASTATDQARKKAAAAARMVTVNVTTVRPQQALGSDRGRPLVIMAS